MDTMMALRAHRRGGPETLGYETAPRPTPAEDEVLIQVAAAAITFAELTWDETWTRNGVDRTPIIPSHEVSGVISEVGAAVTDLEVGSEVYGLIPFDRDGAAAEFVAVPADVLSRKPDTVDHVRAAATPLASPHRLAGTRRPRAVPVRGIGAGPRRCRRGGRVRRPTGQQVGRSRRSHRAGAGRRYRPRLRRARRHRLRE